MSSEDLHTNVEPGGHELTHQTLQGLRMQVSCLRISLEKEREQCKLLSKQIAQNSAKLDHSSVTDEDIATSLKVLSYLKDNKAEITTPRFKDITDIAKNVYSFLILQNYIKRTTKIRKEPEGNQLRRAINSQLMKTTKIRNQDDTNSTMHRKNTLQLPKLEVFKEAEEESDEENKGEEDKEEEDAGGGEIIIDEEASKTGNLTLVKSINCYICKKKFRTLHFFYDKLCISCAEKCYQKRMQTTNLQGKVAIVTGGRIKVGYETALKLLRNGAFVIVTTRFPRHACMCYSHEADYENWCDRLKIYGPLDFCDVKSIETFIEYVTTNFPEIHILINNATQTITRPPEYYQSLLHFESAPISVAAKKLCIYPGESKELISTVGDDSSYWEGEIIDTRPKTSWTSTIDEVPTEEVVEVQKVNVVAPFILCGKLKAHMSQSTGIKFIVNVSAMQGKFYRGWKTSFHPHTNMSKAALNMLTRTCHLEFAAKNIFMNSVDPGWIANDNPLPKALKMDQRIHFLPPLDATESAARVCDPIFSAIQGEPPVHGLFLKDYEKSFW